MAHFKTLYFPVKKFDIKGFNKTLERETSTRVLKFNLICHGGEGTFVLLGFSNLIFLAEFTSKLFYLFFMKPSLSSSLPRLIKELTLGGAKKGHFPFFQTPCQIGLTRQRELPLKLKLVSNSSCFSTLL